MKWIWDQKINEKWMEKRNSWKEIENEGRIEKIHDS